MLEFEVIARGIYHTGQVQIEDHPDRRMPSTPQIQDWIEQYWQERLVAAKQRGTLLFNAPLFRFEKASPQIDGTLVLTLGRTSYQEYVTTRVPQFTTGRSRQELGNPLGVCSVVETNDDYILLDKRTGVDVYEGRYHVIGGFAEPERDTRTGQPDVFGAMSREIREETGIRAGDIAEQYLLGVVYDLCTPHAELCFLTRLHIPLREVLQQRHAEDQEIKRLYSLAVTPESLREFIITHHGNISATGEPALLFYGAWKFGTGWFEKVLQTIS
jgi:hypothetical protein